jgi:energy-coupling factor transporter ATP-binding protein EcfA2
MKIKANYRKHPLESLNGNPLIEAIEVILTESMLIDKLTHKPNFDDCFWEVGELFQQVLLKRMDSIHIPSRYVFSLYNKFMSLILDGYSKYSPMSPETTKLLMSEAQSIRQDTSLSQRSIDRTTAPSVLVHGHSGAGKTKTIRSVLNVIPQVIEHHEYEKKPFRQDQLVWVSFDLPSTPSTKGLALNFFSAVDDALGTDYYEQWKDKSHVSVERHLGQMRIIALTHHLGLVHIDELQFLLKYRKYKEAPSFTTIEALFNKLGIPIVLSSTTSGRNIFLSDSQRPDFTTTRRLLTDREYQISLCKVDSPFYQSFFEALFPAELCTGGIQPGKQFKELFHYLTCGLPAMMTRLASLHHDTIAQLINKNPEKASTYRTDDETRLKMVYGNQFKLISRALANLRAGNIPEFEGEIDKADTKTPALSDNEVKQLAAAKREKMKKALPKLVPDPLGIPPVQSSQSDEETYVQKGGN